MTRLSRIALAACLPVLSALGQIAEQPGVDLQAGLVNSQPESDVKDQLFAKEPQAFNDLTLSFTFDQKQSDPEHPTYVCLLPADEPKLTIGVVEDDTIYVLDVAFKVIASAKFSPHLLGQHTIALVIKRDPRQALSGLWVDGIECLSFSVPSGAWAFSNGQVQFHPDRSPGYAKTDISHLRLYNRALSRPEVIALAQLDQPKPAADTIALLGSTEAVLMAESGWLDAYLALKSAAAPNEKRLALRNLAWEGDTVWRQDRPLNFGPLEQQLDRVQAQRVVLMFGRQECLERGEAGLADFRAALEALVAKCPRGALLMGCLPFNQTPPPQRDLSQLNPLLARYDEAIKAVAEARGGKFFDTAKSCRKQEPWTRDGLTLNANGAWLLGDLTAFALGWLGQNPADADLARLRTLAQAKEQLWHRYWRPSNWAFLYGDRTTQPSSRDHLNPNVRWFPQELEQYRTLIDAKETELWNLSQELGRKLP
jgi:hypothetical protein